MFHKEADKLYLGFKDWRKTPSFFFFLLVTRTRSLIRRKCHRVCLCALQISFVLVVFCSQYICIRRLLISSASETVDRCFYVCIVLMISLELSSIMYSCFLASFKVMLFFCCLQDTVIDTVCYTVPFFREMWIIYLRNDVHII